VLLLRLMRVWMKTCFSICVLKITIVSESSGVNRWFCSNSIKPMCFLNGKTGDNILPEFTNFYTNVFKPNIVDSNKFQIELDSLLSTYMHSRPYSVPRIDIADLTTLLGSLKRRKAAGIDDIVSEHILYAGQQLSVRVRVWHCWSSAALLKTSEYFHFYKISRKSSQAI